MNIKIILLASASAVALVSSAFAAEKEVYEDSTKIEKDADGNYKEKDLTVKTDATGTTTTSEVNANVQVDGNGNTFKNTTTKDVIDPPGVMNKKIINTSNTENIKDGVVKSTRVVTVDGKTIQNETTTTPVTPPSPQQ